MNSEIIWLLIDVQIALGAFDTLYHHELTERLAWRSTAATELRLHAVRNGFYAVLFMLIGWSRPAGLVAAAIIAVLAVEIVITLWDFVEEDLTRRLPASERVTHTLLALNYGAVLALLLPELIAAAHEPTGIAWSGHGVQSWLLTLAAVAVAGFGWRDWLMSGRMAGLETVPAGELARELLAGQHGRQRILVTGATGFVGRRLCAALAESGHEVIALVRSPLAATSLPQPITLVSSLDQIPDDARIDAIVNLAGAPIAEWPWTLRNRLRMLRSRLETTRHVVRLCARLQQRPRVLVSGSAIGWYGVRGDEILTEADKPGRGFAARLCAAWEAEAARAAGLGVRVVRLRTGIVLGRDGGMLARLLPPFDLGLGGPVGSGRQVMSWIARDDLVRLIVFAIASDTLEGPVNATAPWPVRSCEFAAALGAALHRPAFMPLPALPLHLALGEMADELLLGGQRVMPAAALAAGFEFRWPTLAEALQAEVGGMSSAVGTIAVDAQARMGGSPSREAPVS